MGAFLFYAQADYGLGGLGRAAGRFESLRDHRIRRPSQDWRFFYGKLNWIEHLSRARPRYGSGGLGRAAGAAGRRAVRFPTRPLLYVRTTLIDKYIPFNQYVYYEKLIILGNHIS